MANTRRSAVRPLLERVRPILKRIAAALLSVRDYVDGKRNRGYRPEPSYESGQWNRWYKIDKRHKRSLRGLKGLGCHFTQESWNVPRRMVR